MMYTLSFSSSVMQHIQAACDYILSTFNNPTAAENLLDDIETHLQNLKQLPLSHPLVRDEYLAFRGFRMLMVRNYLLFYKVDIDHNIVSIHRFFHGSRNWKDLL